MHLPCPKCGNETLRRNGYAPSGKQRWVCRGRTGDRTFCYTTTRPEAKLRTQAGQPPAEIPTHKVNRDTRRYLITAAQNGTPVHKGFLAALLSACEKLGAKLLVVPLRYKNPTSRWTQSQANEEWWDPAIVPYLCQQRLRLNANLVLAADVRTQPTAPLPLSGFEALTAGESCIIGHTKLQLRCIPTPQHKFPKLLVTTGAVTLPNYTDTKTGKLGEFHHVLGAAMVEIEGKIFHLRQINAEKDGSFYDLNWRFEGNGQAQLFMQGAQGSVLTMGDTHVDSIDPKVEVATFGPGGIVEALGIKTLVWHDLCDGYSVNPHHRGDPFIAFAKQAAGAHHVQREIERAAEFLDEHTGLGMQSFVVDSNHNDFFRRWVLSSDWRQLDPENMEFYLKTALAMLSGAEHTKAGTTYPSPLAYWLKQYCDRDAIECVGPSASLEINGIEYGMHGDRGPNGARGSIKNLRRIGVRSVIGHSHTPGIEEGCYQCGTSTLLRLEYNLGPSSWLNTHVLTYPNGKRTLINIINGKWRIA